MLDYTTEKMKKELDSYIKRHRLSDSEKRKLHDTVKGGPLH